MINCLRCFLANLFFTFHLLQHDVRRPICTHNYVGTLVCYTCVSACACACIGVWVCVRPRSIKMRYVKCQTGNSLLVIYGQQHNNSIASRLITVQFLQTPSKFIDKNATSRFSRPKKSTAKKHSFEFAFVFIFGPCDNLPPRALSR